MSHRGTTAIRTVASSAALVLAVSLAAGCSNSPGEVTPTSPATGTSPATSTKTTPASTSTKPAATTTGSTTGPKNDLDKRKNVVKKTCKVTDSGAEATGIVTNKSDQDVDYSITVTFTNDKATNVGAGSTKVTAKAGQETEWTVTGKFKAPKTVLCVVVAVS